MAIIWTTFACSSPLADMDSLSKKRPKKCRTSVSNRSGNFTACLLFISQRDQRIHARCSACGQVACGERGDGQNGEDSGIRFGIGWSDAVKKASESQAHGRTQTKSDEKSNRRQNETLFQDGTENLMRGSAHGHADAQFARPSLHLECDGGILTHRCDQERSAGKQGQEGCNSPGAGVADFQL